MEDDILTATPEPSPAPEPDPAPSPAPDPDLAPTETELPVSVVSVDELIDRLVQSVETDEEDPEEFVSADLGEDVGDVEVVDVVPGLIGDAIDVLLGIRKGMESVESIEQTVNHPALTTSFQDYTVTEGLLLLVLLCFFVKECGNMVRRAFSWLL